MKFKQTLTEAILLKRHYRFLAEISLKNRQKRMLYCPNLGPMPHCDILGSRIWFSRPTRLSQGCLDVWELTEVNGGWLVCVHSSYTPVLVREAIELGRIPELMDFHNWQTPTVPKIGEGIELLMNNEGEQCFVHLETVLSGDEKNEGYFPNKKGEGIAALKELIALRENGCRTVLLYCIQHNGVYALKTANAVDEQYGILLREAAKKGVEILAYRVSIAMDEIALTTKVPVLLSENTIFH
jgi:sugar fermentation stimulation protein A